MSATFAAKKTKSAVLALLAPRLNRLGYIEFTQERATLRTEYRRQLNDDVSTGLQIEFFDGPIAGPNITHLQVGFGIASRKLLEIYYKLHGEQYSVNFLPIGGTLKAFAPAANRGSWSVELPDKTQQLDHLCSVLAGPVQQILDSLDSAEKQVQQLLEAKRDDIHWNDLFFRPVSYLYLGQLQAAREAAGQVLRSSRSKSFAAAYRSFYERVLAEA